MNTAPALRPECPTCRAQIGELHIQGCSRERCMLCGSQAISCSCVSADIDGNPTDAMWDAYDARVVAAGGREPWSGEAAGNRDARELGLYCKLVGVRWVPCDRDDPEAIPDLNRLTEWHGHVWDIGARQWRRS